jgi:GT2 family glycosyltransferase
MKSVAIIVLNWNKPKLTIETVNSLQKISQKNFSYQIIIVDNGSDDDSISQFNKLYSSSANIKVISTGINEGYVSGNNFGINYALKINLITF